MNMEKNEIFDENQAANYLSITTLSLSALRDGGWFIPCYKLNRKPIYHKWQLDAVKERLENVRSELD